MIFEKNRFSYILRSVLFSALFTVFYPFFPHTFSAAGSPQNGGLTATPSETAPQLTEETIFESSQIPAQVPNEVSDPVSDPIEVVYVMPVSFALFTTEISHAEETVLEKLNEQYMSTRVTLENGDHAFLSIDYDIDSLEQRQPGFFLLYGTVESTEQYYVPPEIADVTFPIFLYDPANPCEMPVQEVSPIVSPTLSLPEGASQELLASSLAKNYNINFRLEGGVFWSAPLAWNPEGVDLSVPGNYTVTGTPQLPEGILLPEEFSSVSCEVCVQSGLIKVSHVIASGSQSLITADLAYAEEQVSHALANPNDSYLKAAVKLENGTRTIFPVKYHTGPLSDARTGLFVLDGKIEPPEGYSIPPELAKVTALAFLYDPAAPCELPAVTILPITRPQLLLPAGTSREEISAMLGVNKNATYELDGGFLFSAPLSWNLEDLPTDTPGNYTVTGFPALPEGLLLPEEFSSVSCEVCLQDDTKLTLSPPVINQYTLFMEWYKKTPEKNLFQFYYAVGDGEWQEDVSGGFMRLKSDSQTLEVDFSGNESLLLGTSYFFRLQYDGEWSNTIEIFLEEGSLRYRWCDGDRDGGDRNEQESPDIIQNVPDTPPEETVPSDNAPLETVPSDDAPPVTETFPSSEGVSSSLPRTHSFTGGGRKNPGTKQSKDTEGYGPGYPEEALSVTENQAAQVAGDESAVKEEFEKDTGNTAVWSGTRIKAYKNLNTGWPLLFEKQQICLELPVDDPLFYDLTSNDLLHVEIEALTDRTVQIELNWNKNYITGLPITVTMPWDISNGCKDLRVTDSEGNFVGEAIYNAADSRISFQAEGSGTFTIESSAVPSLSQTPDPPSVNDNISSGKNSPIPTEKTSYASEAKDTTAPYIIAITVLAAALVLAGGILCFRNHPKGGGDNT